MKKTGRQDWWYRMTSKLPLAKAWGIIALSVFLVTGPVAFTLLYYRHLQNSRLQDSRYSIEAVIQTGLEKQQLNTRYLAEVLGLSVDKPKHLYQFDAKEAERKLRQSPLIKEALVKKIPPRTLYIDYAIRKPVAYLMDVENAAVDDEGVMIPFNPFFTPKRLPGIYLGCGGERWGLSLFSPKLELAFSVIATVRKEAKLHSGALVAVDTSAASEESCGCRQVVVVLQETVDDRPIRVVLRLSSERYAREIRRYCKIRSRVLEVLANEVVVDLRMDQLAFINAMVERKY